MAENSMTPSLLKFKKSLEVLEKIFAELPLQQIKLFLTVAEHEGSTMPELMKILHTPQGTLSRNVKALSVYLREDPKDPTKRSKAGYELLDTKPDAVNRKALAVYLTPKARMILREISDIISTEGE